MKLSLQGDSRKVEESDVNIGAPADGDVFVVVDDRRGRDKIECESVRGRRETRAGEPRKATTSSGIIGSAAQIVWLLLFTVEREIDDAAEPVVAHDVELGAYSCTLANVRVSCNRGNPRTCEVEGERNW